MAQEFKPPQIKNRFWVCPCFTAYPDAVLEAEEELTKFLYQKNSEAMGAENLCVNRQLAIYVELLAKCAAKIPAKGRADFDAQIADYLSGALDRNPSKV